jgi:tRNA 2-selenouridine synthase SelU
MDILKRVGREISSHDYLKSRSGSYNDEIDGAYHKHRLSVIDRLLKEITFQSSIAVDLGCGDGVMIDNLAR